jgi:hypothetical protein
MRFALSLLALISATTAAAESDWQSQIHFLDRSASASRTAAGYVLDANGSKREIPKQPATSETASALVDALFALAQAEAAEARTTQLSDGAYNHGKPIPCDCFVTGVKWPFVWTRDSAYSIDLALGWLDPARARRTLEFKLSDVRVKSAPQGLYVVQDTGSGGSWPISTDRVAWFLGARHLLDDAAFADKVYKALKDTLAQDREYVFDAHTGLYRGETSFLDWREQTYPAWTKDDVRFIAESYALSTNVLHYAALHLAQQVATKRGEKADATRYAEQATALAATIDKVFWREERGTYASYVGTSGGALLPVDTYDLLGTALTISEGVAPPAHAKRALANYPTWNAGSPVIWPERSDVAIYHNRAIWPFVSAYALRAARATDDVPRIAHELKSILRGAALAGSNMENYEFTTQVTHMEDGKFSGPVVNSPRQLWSVAAMLDAIVEGIFGVEGDAVAPKIPVELRQMLFGDKDTIALRLPERTVVLTQPHDLPKEANLLVAGETHVDGNTIRVQLRGAHVDTSALKLDAPQFAPPAPRRPSVGMDVDEWVVRNRDHKDFKLYTNAHGDDTLQSVASVPIRGAAQCFVLTHVDPATHLESLPSPEQCVQDEVPTTTSTWPRQWSVPDTGMYQAHLVYINPHGPINTGVTAAVKRLAIRCDTSPEQIAPVVMPHSVGQQWSTAVTFSARQGQRCIFELRDGFNMSYLTRNTLYTGEQGGASGAVNEAQIKDLQISPLPREEKP